MWQLCLLSLLVSVHSLPMRLRSNPNEKPTVERRDREEQHLPPPLPLLPNPELLPRPLRNPEQQQREPERELKCLRGFEKKRQAEGAVGKIFDGLQPGTTYKVVKFLASGGYGSAFAVEKFVHDTKQPGLLAAKFVREVEDPSPNKGNHEMDEPEAAEFFYREFELQNKAADVDLSPHVYENFICIENYQDEGTTKKHHIGVAIMDLLEGKTLREHLREWKKMKIGLEAIKNEQAEKEVENKEKIIRGIVEEGKDLLIRLHTETHICHKDANPGNIFASEKRAYLIDFGLAQVMTVEELKECPDLGELDVAELYKQALREK